MKRIFLIAMLIAFVVIPTQAHRPQIPPTTADMAGAWFGFDNHENFLRLDLKPDGSGTLVWLQLGGESRSIYDIPKWNWEDSKWRLRFSVKPREAKYEEITLRIERAGWHEIAISFQGKSLKWSREARLRKEREVLEKLKAASLE